MSAAAAALIFAATASAVTITGSLDFVGTFTAGNADLTTADNTLVFSDVMKFGGSTGSFASILSGTPVTFASSFVTNVSGNGVTLVSAPNLTYPDLWTVAGFTFSMTSIFEYGTNDTNNISISALGTISNGVDTPRGGVWRATFQNVSGQVESTFSSSAGTVPDSGSTIALLGASLIGLFCFARRKE